MQNMQKKLFPIFSIVLLLISLVAPGIQPVGAEEKEDVVYEDGEYDIIAKALNANSDEESGAAGFINEKAKIIVKDKEIKLAITVPHNDMAEIKGLQVEGIEPIKDEQDGSTIYTYKLNELKEMLNARTQYVVPMMGIDHDVPLRFNLEGLEDIPVVEETPEVDNGAGDGDESEGDKDAEDGDESEGDKDAEDGDESEGDKDAEDGDESEGDKDAEDGDESEGDKDAEDGDESEGDKDTDGGDESENNTGTETVEKKIYEDGKFDLDFSVDVSAMNRFMEKPAKIEINEGTNEVTLRFNSQQFIANFEIEKEGKLVEAQKKQIDDDYVDYTFTVDNLDEPLASKVTVDTGRTIMPHEFNINFDTSNLKEVKLDHEDLADGTYSINYDLLHASEDKASSAANYLVRPAQLKVVDGEKTVYFQITDHEAIKDFKVEQNGKLVSSKIVKVNENANSRQVAIEVDDLAEELETQFSVFIPAMGYEANPYARLQFDTDSIKKSDGQLPDVSFKPEKLEEGQAYEMNMRVLTEDGFEKSPVGSYIKMPIDLTVDKGKNMALLTLLNSDEVKDFKIKKNDNSASTQLMSLSNLSKITQDDYESVPVVKVDEKKNERIIALEVDDLDGQVDALVIIGDTEHSVRLFFEENSIRESQGLPVEDLEEVEKPVDPETPEESEEESGESDLDPKNLSAGTYKLDYTFLEKGKDNPSTMDNFTDGPAYVKVDKKGNKSVALTLTSTDMVGYFKVNGEDAKILQENKDKETRVVEFPVKDLTKKQSGVVYVSVPGLYSSEHSVDLAFDTKTLEESNKYPEDENIEQPDEEEDEKTPPKPEIPEKPVNDKLDPANLDAGSYKVEYSFLEKGTNTVSIMDGFTEGPAYVKKDKNGNQRVAITFTGADYIKGFEVNGTSAKVLQLDKKKDTMVVEFPVKDLTKKQNAWVAVKVPGVYDTEHDVDLVFHVTTLDELEQYPEDEKPEKMLSKSSSNGKQNEDPVPDFDRDADGNIIGSNGDSGSGINPKTADLNMTQIMLFGSLLLLSLIPLVIKLRRRFVTEE